MKILHIWDQAVVACILAKNHRRMGHEVRILKRAGYDPFGISQFYNEPLLDQDGQAFLKYATDEVADYDVLHVHALYKIIPDQRKKYRDKKLLLHYHGAEARDKQGDPLKAEAESKADLILGSTGDLKEFVEGIVHLPGIALNTIHTTKTRIISCFSLTKSLYRESSGCIRNQI